MKCLTSGGDTTTEVNPIENEERFRTAIERFDAANREDPNVEIHEGQRFPKELLYAQRMTKCLERLAPGAPETVRLAAQAQHIRRWEIPRSAYTKDRQGYRQWRTELGRFHAETTGKILAEVGYDVQTIQRVQALLRKDRLKADPECQLLEDVICVVFLQYYAFDFSKEHDEAKLINILSRTWKKMSPCGHQAALDLDLPESIRGLINKVRE